LEFQAEQFAAVKECADAAVVGKVIVQVIERSRHGSESRAEFIKQL
jgi:tryptophan synthase alpha subunit